MDMTLALSANSYLPAEGANSASDGRLATRKTEISS